MKKVFFILMIIMLVGALVLAGCAKTTAPATGPAVELKFASVSMPTHVHQAYVAIPWAKKIEEASNGRIKVNFYFGQSLAKYAECYDAAVTGVSDVSFGLQFMTPGRFPLSSVMELPLIFTDSDEGSRCFWHLYEKFPELKAEYNDVHVLWLNTTPPANLMTNKPVRTLDDLKGMKLGVPGALLVKVMQMAGAAPVQMASQDMYLALDTSLVDGVVSTIESMEPRKVYEVTKYFSSTAGLGGFGYFWVMNLKTWNSLPSDLQKIIDENSGETWSALTGEEIKKGEAASIESMKMNKAQLVELPASEMAKFRGFIKPVWDEWAAQMESKGLPGKAVLDEAVKFLEEYRK